MSQKQVVIKYKNLISTTLLAVKVETRRGIEWFPKSAITLDKEHKEIRIPTWLFLKRYAKK